MLLGMSTHLSLDMIALLQYNGKGNFRREYTYIEELVKWAQRINWEVEQDHSFGYCNYYIDYFITVQRKQDKMINRSIENISKVFKVFKVFKVSKVSKDV